MSGKILRDETYVRNLEGFSVQIRKTAGIRGKAEGELVGVERLNFAVVLLVELAVFAVAEQGIARGDPARPCARGSGGSCR